jgi:hypothetical protein
MSRRFCIEGLPWQILKGGDETDREEEIPDRSNANVNAGVNLIINEISSKCEARSQCKGEAYRMLELLCLSTLFILPASNRKLLGWDAQYKTLLDSVP